MGVRNGIKHYWQVDEWEQELDLAVRVVDEPIMEEETEWLEDETYRFVADFPVGFYEQMVSCDPDVMPMVAIWVEED